VPPKSGTGCRPARSTFSVCACAPLALLSSPAAAPQRARMRWIRATAPDGGVTGSQSRSGLPRSRPQMPAQRWFRCSLVLLGVGVGWKECAAVLAGHGFPRARRRRQLLAQAFGALPLQCLRRGRHGGDKMRNHDAPRECTDQGVAAHGLRRRFAFRRFEGDLAKKDAGQAENVVGAAGRVVRRLQVPRSSFQLRGQKESHRGCQRPGRCMEHGALRSHYRHGSGR